MHLEQLDHVAIAVRDVERSVEWYRDVLGLERRHEVWGSYPAMVCAGSSCVALFPIDGDESHPAPGPETDTMLHLAFRADRPGFERAQAELREREIEFEFQDHDIAHSIYFRDPDGHELEITTYDPT
jgi:catechol 2,3-dioxygenase-like lactoylglutathione lyase family enzyme